ncbi:YoaK family protein [Lactobacillus terrae]|uniref:YoaK family protein n=1 Tax=Lactobacillus terrae TaxID=2269374 RepID=UPI000C1B79B2|nr:YoaK family protein [Lactobacillus terrae]
MSKFPIYERTLFAQILAITAGGIDTYTYLTHNGVFATMQTGNLILLGINLAQLKFGDAFNHLWPILIFCLGAAITTLLQLKIHNKKVRHQSNVMIFEIVALLIVGIITNFVPIIVTSLIVSFTAAVQFVTFNKLHDMPLNTLMMTGNIKNVGQFFVKGFVEKDPKFIRRSWRTLRVISSFFIGIIINAVLVHYVGNYAIFFDVVILCSALFMLLKERASV